MAFPHLLATAIDPLSPRHAPFQAREVGLYRRSASAATRAAKPRWNAWGSSKETRRKVSSEGMQVDANGVASNPRSSFMGESPFGLLRSGPLLTRRESLLRPE